MEHPENDEPDHEDFEMGDLSIEEYNQQRGYDQHGINFIRDSLNNVSQIWINDHICPGD